MEKIFRRLFKQHFGKPPVTILEIAGDGSSRQMHRLVGEEMETAVAVTGPDADENRAFLAFTEAFRSIGLPVPQVYGVDEKAGIYLEEDLGETTLFDAVTMARREEPGADFPASMVPVYRRILELLPRFQVEGGRAVDYSVAYPRAAFDRQSILWDLNYFKYHFLKLAHIPFNEARLEKDFRRFATFLLAADTRHFLYRDFQSRNVMLRDGEPWFIDYQGGRRGALQYDVASLLYDPKVGLTEPAARGAARPLPRPAGAVPARGPRALSPAFSRLRARAHHAGDGRVRLPRLLRAQAAVPAERAAGRAQPGAHPGNGVRAASSCRSCAPCSSASAARRRCGASPRRPLPGLTVHVGSFSFKHGYPDDQGGHGGGFVFDCRAIHNPGRYTEYTSLCGCDEPVAYFLEQQPEVEEFWTSVRNLVESHVGVWLTRGFSSLSVYFGCTGGPAPLRLLRRAAGGVPERALPVGARGRDAPRAGALAGARAGGKGRAGCRRRGRGRRFHAGVDAWMP